MTRKKPKPIVCEVCGREFATCPICGKEIDCLLNYQSGEKAFLMNTHGDYEEWEFIPDDDVNDWECPECHEVVATSEEDALDILNPTDKR